MTGIVGARGVGKTTFLIQYLKALDIPFEQKLYISADTITIRFNLYCYQREK